MPSGVIHAMTSWSTGDTLNAKVPVAGNGDIVDVPGSVGLLPDPPQAAAISAINPGAIADEARRWSRAAIREF